MNRLAATLGITSLAGVALLGASHLAISGENAPKPLASVTAPAVAASAWMNPPARTETRAVRKIAMVETVPARPEPVVLPASAYRTEAAPVAAHEATAFPLPPARPAQASLAVRPARVAQKAKPATVAMARVPAETQVAYVQTAPVQPAAERTRMAGPIGDILGGLGILD